VTRRTAGRAGAVRTRQVTRVDQHSVHDGPFIRRACEDLCAELFGASQPDRAASIHAQLRALAAQCDPARGDFGALSPGPVLDRCLGRLVSIVRGQFDAELPDSARAPIAAELARTIARDPTLARKARHVRRIAGCAEAHMERHVCAALLETLAERRAAPSGLPNRLEALREVFAVFPYFDSYTRLIRAELSLLQLPVVPLFVRTDSALELEPAAGQLLAQLQARCAESLGTCAPAASLRGLAGKTIAVCGCGPLPLTGLLLHLVLIDRDPLALHQATQLVSELARVGVLPPDRFTLLSADAGELEYGPEASAHERHVRCDVVLVASLVPHAIKARIAQRVREARSRAPLAMILRSAAGLCAELAYEPVRTEQISGLGLVYCGHSAPRWNGAEAACSAARGVLRELRVAAHPSVLNTSELYVRTPCALTHDPLGAAPWPWSAERIERGLRLLCA
jgi:hypothetical protein